MADFQQAGPITTLHRLQGDRLGALEADLLRISSQVGVGLVLPALFAEFERPPMRRIVEELRDVGYLRRIVVAVGRATKAEVAIAREFFRGFRSPVTILWMDDPAVQEFFQRIEQCGLSAGSEGKGRACWLAFGLLLGEGECDAIALHDCDIANYSREILAKLCFPVAHPALGFEFCKGFYARVTDRLHGRATRLFVAPLVQAMQRSAPEAPFLSYLASFRYPLAGEFSIAAELLRRSRMPSDWGLEVGMLAEMYRNTTPRRICQIEVAENYEHKHQPLCPQDPAKGLRKMTIDIGKALLRAAAAEGVAVSEDYLRNLDLQYRQSAEEMIDRYEAEALVNGLLFDRHEEESMVQAFAQSLRDAAQGFRNESVPLPSWNRVQAALPEAFDWLAQCGTHKSEASRFVLPSWSIPAASERALVRRAV